MNALNSTNPAHYDMLPFVLCALRSANMRECVFLAQFFDTPIFAVQHLEGAVCSQKHKRSRFAGLRIHPGRGAGKSLETNMFLAQWFAAPRRVEGADG